VGACLCVFAVLYVKGDWGNRLMFLLFFDFFLELAGKLCIIALIEEETYNTHEHPSEQTDYIRAC
jgi:hypothetical protein